MEKIDIQEVTYDNLPFYEKDCLDLVKKGVDFQAVYQTNHYYKILEDKKINRIYIYDELSNDFEGLTTHEINYLIEYFEIKDAHVFLYAYNPEEQILTIGKIREGECIF